MRRYKTVEITPADVGKEQAEMLGALVTNLKKQGLSENMIEKIAVNISGAASSWLDGCKGMENPAEMITNPAEMITNPIRSDKIGR